MLGGIPEAEIIKGIVDWTIQRAKEELMQAFLQKWLDDIEKDPVLQTAFPNTLHLLSTTDLATVFSQGDTWKAAFQQDLDAIPSHLPEIVEKILDELPRKPDPEIEREIVGMVNVASQLYVQIDRNKNNLSDAIRLISASLMLKTDTLAYTERAAVAANVLIKAVHTRESDREKILSPAAILELDSTELCDFWNVIFLQNKEELKKIFGVSSLKPIYNETIKKIREFQLILSRTADIVQNIKDLLNISPGSGSSVPNGVQTAGNSTTGSRVTLSFQEARAYYELTFELMNNCLDLATLLGKPEPKVEQVLNDVVLPLGEDVMDIAEGVATQQYGAVVSNSISLLTTLSNEVVRDPELRAALNGAASLLELGEDFRKAIKNKSGSGSDLKAEGLELLNKWLNNNRGLKSDELIRIVTDIRDAVQQFGETDLSSVKNFLKDQFKDLRDKLKDYIKAQDLGQGIDQLADLFNKYGTLMVNVLTATTSEDVSEALKEAAAPVGSYMVKQTSCTSLTLTLYPGGGIGHEIPRFSRDLVGQGVDTLIDPSGFASFTLPVGLEWAFAVPSRVLGAVGIYGQVLDLGAVLNYRLSGGNDTLINNQELSFARVLAPGIGLTLHPSKIPIVIGGRMAYQPQLRDISNGGTLETGLNVMQFGAFIAVDINAFTLFASRKKINVANRNTTYRND